MREAVQLLTSHKAKGLEWQTVIVPFVFRAIETKTASYPRLVHGEGGREMVFRDKADYDAQAKVFVNERDRQQLQRLLYVTCTRARHTLVLVDDEVLFDGQMQRGGWSSPSCSASSAGVNRVTWGALPEELAAAPQGKAKPAVESPSSRNRRRFQNATRPGPSSTPRPFREGRRLTPWRSILPRKANPRRSLNGRRIRPAGENPGILYGTWWHQFVQTVPWEKPRAEWSAVSRRPSPARPSRSGAEREWKLFCASPLAEWLAVPGRIIHREIPFLWLEEAGACLEGVIDLAVSTPGEPAWHVIDWKTNRSSEIDWVEVYRGQMEAYARALGKMLSAEVKASLYLTATGVWIPVV